MLQINFPPIEVNVRIENSNMDPKLFTQDDKRGRVIRNAIGPFLRTNYEISEPMPERIVILLDELARIVTLEKRSGGNHTQEDSK